MLLYGTRRLHTYIHTYIHTYTHTHTHTRAPKDAVRPAQVLQPGDLVALCIFPARRFDVEDPPPARVLHDMYGCQIWCVRHDMYGYQIWCVLHCMYGYQIECVFPRVHVMRGICRPRASSFPRPLSPMVRRFVSWIQPSDKGVS